MKTNHENAFPEVYTANGQARSGMKLRDWFAGQALAGLLGCDGPNDLDMPLEDLPRYYASRAYAYADAMIAGREKP